MIAYMEIRDFINQVLMIAYMEIHDFNTLTFNHYFRDLPSAFHCYVWISNIIKVLAFTSGEVSLVYHSSYLRLW